MCRCRRCSWKFSLPTVDDEPCNSCGSCLWFKKCYEYLVPDYFAVARLPCGSEVPFGMNLLRCNFQMFRQTSSYNCCSTIIPYFRFQKVLSKRIIIYEKGFRCWSCNQPEYVCQCDSEWIGTVPTLLYQWNCSFCTLTSDECECYALYIGEEELSTAHSASFQFQRIIASIYELLGDDDLSEFQDDDNDNLCDQPELNSIQTHGNKVFLSIVQLINIVESWLIIQSFAHTLAPEYFRIYYEIRPPELAPITEISSY